jgi:tetratricopeptide (TPR) repeat protein
MPDISLRRIDQGGTTPRLNVVFLHGLGGDPITTWCHKGDEHGGYFWLKGLAEEIENIAVWTVGYPSDKAAWNVGWPVATAATAVLDKLMSSREFRATGEAPIAFICHSLGGLIAKKLVLTAHFDRGQQPLKGTFLDRIAGIVFLATPHSGSIIANIAEIFHWFVSQSIGDLKASDAALLDLSHTYRDRIANGEATIKHRVYYEMEGLIGPKKLVMPASADPGLPGVRPIPVNRNHTGIAKPTRTDDVVFEGIIAFLQDDVLQPRQPTQSQKLDKLQATVEALVDALSENRELSLKLKAADIDRQKVMALARRTAEHVEDFDQALKELAAHSQVAIEVQQEGRRSNLGAFVDAVLARVRTKYEVNDFDGAAHEADKGFAEWERQEAERRDEAIQAGLKILETGLNQDILRRNASSAASRIARMAALRHPEHRKDRLALLDAAYDEWHERGRDKGLNFDLEIAIEIARHTLQDCTVLEEKVYWQNNLGIALSMLGERESGTARLEEAVAAYRTALADLTPRQMPLKWATAQDNLGITLSTLGERESGTARLKEAVTAYRAALKERTRERVPLDWAATQNNLGTALWILGGRESGTARLKEAVTAYRTALKERTRERVPLDWAETQNNLGIVFSTLGERESGTARLKEAVAAYCAALEERTRERVPLDWAATQNNLGCALATLGERERSTAKLEKAVAACQAALEERTRERVPLDWAGTQNHLGIALRVLGEREHGEMRLQEAINAFREALRENSRERVPLDWAISYGNQGIAMRILAERKADLPLAKQAFAQIEAAKDVSREGGHVPNAVYFEEQAVLAQALVEKLSRRET